MQSPLSHIVTEDYIRVITEDESILNELSKYSFLLKPLINRLMCLGGLVLIDKQGNKYVVNVTSKVYKLTFTTDTARDVVDKLTGIGQTLKRQIRDQDFCRVLRSLSNLEAVKINAKVLLDIEDTNKLRDLVNELIGYDSILSYNNSSISIFKYESENHINSYGLYLNKLNDRHKMEFSGKTGLEVDDLIKAVSDYVSTLNRPEYFLRTGLE